MENKQDYLAKLQVAVSRLHNCGATWRETVPVHEVFQGKTVWQGDVEVFDLTGHPKANRAYAWSHLDGENDERMRFVAVLEIPPVESARSAVRVQIAKEVKEKSAAKLEADKRNCKHDWEFFDSCPGIEVFECRICKLKTFVDIKTGRKSFK